MHREEYARKRSWEISHHIKMWDIAYCAFNNKDFNAFEKLFEILRKEWQIFRPKKEIPGAIEVFRMLNGIDEKIANTKLSNLKISQLPGLMETLKTTAEIKRTKDSISIMAVSKFLHFRNPSLFIIKDKAVIENFVLEHAWIRDGINEINKELVVMCEKGNGIDAKIKNQFEQYIAFLLWGAKLINDNPVIVEEFINVIRREYRNESDLKIKLEDIESYDAAAVEWFLLGVTHLPPVSVL